LVLCPELIRNKDITGEWDIAIGGLVLEGDFKLGFIEKIKKRENVRQLK